MRIGIVTQPLCANYGGILQNCALQTVLKNMGHDPITLDLSTHLNISKKAYVRYCFTTLLKNILKGERKKLLSYNQNRPGVFNDFVSKNINTTEIIKEYYPAIIDRYDLDCLIVGSDQVWRPKFNVFPEDMYLSFAEGKSIIRIAYAASFGVDEWEYSDELTKRCRKLVSIFKGVSVREESGVRLCSDYLNVTADWVIDPTLLLSSDYYSSLCKNIEITGEKFIAVYTLNISGKIKQVINSFAQKIGMGVKYFTSDASFTLSIPEWIAVFRDASYVITDSFHGTAFSIIFKKDFITLVNNNRGASRFHSILNLLGLNDRLKNTEETDFSMLNKTIDWIAVDKKLNSSIEKSVVFLKNNLK